MKTFGFSLVFALLGLSGCSSYMFVYLTQGDQPVTIRRIELSDSVHVHETTARPSGMGGYGPYPVKLPQETTVGWNVSDQKYEAKIRWNEIKKSGTQIILLFDDATVRVARRDAKLMGFYPEVIAYVREHGKTFRGVPK